MDNEFEMCCGNTCNKRVVEVELKVAGALGFIEWIQANATEDMSDDALKRYLLSYVDTL